MIVDIGVRRFVIRYVQESHTGRLSPKLIAYEGQARAVQRCPHLFDVHVIHEMRLSDGEWIQCYGQYALERCQTVGGHE